MISKTDLVKDLQSHWEDLLQRIHKKPVVIEEESTPLAVLVSYQEWQRIQHMQDELWKAQTAEAACEGPLCEEDTKD
ncbi:type II toxin-antitoxin system Phd/YefM family antitoxin [Sulfobacillus thermosulfidooxidans]|uniref:type II toxin-antitoxin system Phd/YefM family antitoxin n=1 Tax=Sulfobacillus thermosulfidooxidans TaxID=28034 RepID=UPI0006B57CBC|nr:type II toxin-antitoxin system Phd/YefM family antitoxin [Sulfobacillus thermosulfidooxidans]